MSSANPAADGEIEISNPVQVVPGPHLPDEVEVGRSNNNLDIAFFNDRLWFVWRTSKSHFASSASRLYIVSSGDMGKSWRYEHTIEPGCDIREPRLFVFNGKLFLYWFEAGTSAVKFEPGRVYVSKLEGSDPESADPEGPSRGGPRWSEKVAISEPGYVVWRPRIVAGRAVMTVYSGGESIYTAHPEPTGVEIWESSDGINWSALDPDSPVVHRGGTETEVLEAPDGGLIAVTRKEGPFGGWGSDVCRSDADDWSAWNRCRSDPRKLDSPLMFSSGGRYFVIARRQPAFGGRYDLGLAGVPDVVKTRLCQAVYWLTTKRTAIYEVDPETLEITYLDDLPSRGDTSFAGIVESGEGEFLVYNYSSPLEARDRVWLEGQIQETRIYSTRVRIR